MTVARASEKKTVTQTSEQLRDGHTDIRARDGHTDIRARDGTQTSEQIMHDTSLHNFPGPNKPSECSLMAGACATMRS